MDEVIGGVIGGWAGIVGVTILQGIFSGAWRNAENQGKTFGKWVRPRILIGTALAIPITLIPVISRM